MKARSIMTTQPAMVTPEQSVVHAAALMRDHDVGLVPVVDHLATMQLVGVLTDRDIATRCVSRARIPADCRVRECMTADPLTTVRPDATVEQVIATMERARVRRVPVVKADGTLVGIVAQADLAVKLGPKAPLAVEHLLESLSEPVHAAAGR